MQQDLNAFQKAIEASLQFFISAVLLKKGIVPWQAQGLQLNEIVNFLVHPIAAMFVSLCLIIYGLQWNIEHLAAYVGKVSCNCDIK